MPPASDATDATVPTSTLAMLVPAREMDSPYTVVPATAATRNWIPPGSAVQRCWFHKIANVLSAPPRSAHPGAKKALAGIWNAEDREHARRAVAAFKLAYGAKFAKAVAKVTDDLDQLLAFYDYPAEHWIHLRTTNPIESTFATVRNRSKITKGPGS
jgi:putative transposase